MLRLVVLSQETLTRLCELSELAKLGEFAEFKEFVGFRTNEDHIIVDRIRRREK